MDTNTTPLEIVPYIMGQSLVLDYKLKIVPYLMREIFSAWLEIGEYHLAVFPHSSSNIFRSIFFLNLGNLDRNSALQLQKKILINEWSFLSENSLIKAWVYLRVLLTLSWPSNYHQIILYGVITHNQMFIWLLKQQ